MTPNNNDIWLGSAALTPSVIHSAQPWAKEPVSILSGTEPHSSNMHTLGTFLARPRSLLDIDTLRALTIMSERSCCDTIFVTEHFHWSIWSCIESVFEDPTHTHTWFINPYAPVASLSPLLRSSPRPAPLLRFKIKWNQWNRRNKDRK